MKLQEQVENLLMQEPPLNVGSANLSVFRFQGKVWGKACDHFLQDSVKLGPLLFVKSLRESSMIDGRRT